jgi:hypothetical protein
MHRVETKSEEASLTLQDLRNMSAPRRQPVAKSGACKPTGVASGSLVDHSFLCTASSASKRKRQTAAKAGVRKAPSKTRKRLGSTEKEAIEALSQLKVIPTHV